MIKLNDITISSFDQNQLKQFIIKSIKENSTKNLIITLNIDFLRESKNNAMFHEICKNASIVLPDGIGVTSLINLKYKKKLHRITGNDLFALILDIANENKFKIAFVGTTEISLKKMILKIEESYPDINVVYSNSPSNKFEYIKEENDNIVSELVNKKPDILLVALGCPRQEIWLDKNKEVIGACINSGIGAAFDYFSGVRKRSPKILQRIGLEWFWRLITEPRRLFKRYLINDIPFYISSAYKIWKHKTLL
jgi:N-acetylglucosaminyldiphosphoundecaprenol N-acetyl-beta-D-mannosaminyltransferase